MVKTQNPGPSLHHHSNDNASLHNGWFPVNSNWRINCAKYYFRFWFALSYTSPAENYSTPAMVYNNWLSLFLWWLFTFLGNFGRVVLYLCHCMGSWAVHALWCTITRFLYCTSCFGVYFSGAYVLSGLYLIFTLIQRSFCNLFYGTPQIAST